MRRISRGHIPGGGRFYGGGDFGAYEYGDTQPQTVPLLPMQTRQGRGRGAFTQVARGCPGDAPEARTPRGGIFDGFSVGHGVCGFAEPQKYVVPLAQPWTERLPNPGAHLPEVPFAPESTAGGPDGLGFNPQPEPPHGYSRYRYRRF